MELPRGNVADIDAQDEEGNTELHRAVNSNNGDLVQELIQIGAKVNIQNNQQHTPLHLATMKRYIPIMEILLQANADWDNIDFSGNMGAHHAAFNGNCEVMEILLESGLDVNSQNKKGHSLLHLAAREGRTDLVQLLISKGVEINVINKAGKTPLHRAAYLGHTKIVTLLLEAQPEVHQSTDGVSFLHEAALGNRLHTIQTVFTDFPLTIRSLSVYLARSAADYASAAGGNDCTWWLRKQMTKDTGICGPSTSSLDDSKKMYEKSGSNIIERAGMEGKREAKWLKKSATDGQIEPHYMDEQGDTILHAAVRGGNEDTVTSLIEVGALLVARNYQNQTPVDIANSMGTSLQDYLPKEPDTQLDSRIASQLYSILLNIIAGTTDLDDPDRRIQTSPTGSENNLDRQVQQNKVQITMTVSRLLAWGVPHERLGSCDRPILPLAVKTNNRTLLPMLLAAGFPLTTTDSGLGLVQLAWLTPDITIWVGMVVTRAVVNTLKWEHKMLLEMLKDEAVEGSCLLYLTRSLNNLILEDLSGEKPWEAQFMSPDSASLTQLYLTACRYGATLTAWYVWKAGGSNYDRELPYDCTALEAALDGGHSSTALRLVLDMDANPFLKNKEGKLPVDLFPRSYISWRFVMLGKDYRALDKMAEKFKDEDDKRELQQILEINFHETEIPIPENFNSDKDINLLQLKALKVCCEKPLPLFLHLLTSLTSPDLESILNEVCESRPLHHAAKSGNSSAVAYLLECGASPLSKDRSDISPIQYAAMFGHRETENILIRNLTTDSEKSKRIKLEQSFSEHYEKYLNHYGLSRGDTGKSRYVNVQTYEKLLTSRFDHIKKQLLEKGVENFATENLVSYTDGEAREIKDAVTQFLYLLNEQISLKNKMFEGDIGFVGSSEDNVRLYCPDEYDCNLVLKKISAYPDGEIKAELIDLDEAKAIQYGHKKSLKVQPVREDLRSLMKGTCFLDSFYNIARESLTEMDLNGGKLKVIMPGIKRTQVGINLSFLWLGTEYPMLFIDVDFVPTVRAPWPEGLPKPNCSLDRRHLKEVYLSNVGEDEWRLSFGPTESKIMRGLSVNKRDVFLVCKMILAAFKTENWVPAEIKNQFMYWDSRMFSLHSKGGFALKNCFFQELKSITNEEEWTKDKILKRVKSVFERMCLIEEQRSLVGGMEVDGQYPKPVKAYFGGDTEKNSEYFIAPEIVRFLRDVNKD
ncbi:serine/threonine-protein phosphatase 6 regulatory ankyrin repeat subunit A-like [Macrobrachium nipponense]|uniref:serine/threonine-protein phosphatase 6 regulatory ankyrin repeat subunit A-like n=1 Tax=Macrobrachium nipponense TaxID=159736 RepID=UPI0030C8A774